MLWKLGHSPKNRIIQSSRALVGQSSATKAESRGVSNHVQTWAGGAWCGCGSSIIRHFLKMNLLHSVDHPRAKILGTSNFIPGFSFQLFSVLQESQDPTAGKENQHSEFSFFAFNWIQANMEAGALHEMNWNEASHVIPCWFWILFQFSVPWNIMKLFASASWAVWRCTRS